MFQPKVLFYINHTPKNLKIPQATPQLSTTKLHIGGVSRALELRLITFLKE